jgi:hypothetical protein
MQPIFQEITNYTNFMYVYPDGLTSQLSVVLLYLSVDSTDLVTVSKVDSIQVITLLESVRHLNLTCAASCNIRTVRITTRVLWRLPAQ